MTISVFDDVLKKESQWVTLVTVAQPQYFRDYPKFITKNDLF